VVGFVFIMIEYSSNNLLLQIVLSKELRAES